MSVEVVLFTLVQERYGVPANQVESIEPPLSVTRLPGTAAFVMGLTNLRGTVIPVIDLRKFGWNTHVEHLNAADEVFVEATEERVLVVHVGEITAGLRVDEVLDVMNVDFVRENPSGMIETQAAQGDLFDGITYLEQRPVGLIRLNTVLNPTFVLATRPGELR